MSKSRIAGKIAKVYTNDKKCERMRASTFIRDFCYTNKYKNHNLVSVTCGDTELLPRSYFDIKPPRHILDEDVVSIQLPPMTM